MLIDQDLIDAARVRDACATGVALATAMLGRPVAWLRAGDLRWLCSHKLADVAPVPPPAEVLAQLARDPNEYVRWAVAGHPATPPEALAGLARDPSEYVRWSVARHPSATAETLAQLARDPDRYVRAAVAENGAGR